MDLNVLGKMETENIKAVTNTLLGTADNEIVLQIHGWKTWTSLNKDQMLSTQFPFWHIFDNVDYSY